MTIEGIDFLIIGATKSATTWLQQSLQQRPDIYMPDPELHYFSRYYDNGPDWYRQQFAGRSGQPIAGEKSNSYMDTPEAAGRIARDLPNVKLIAQLRNPVERAYSDFCMLYRRGEVGRNIEDHLDPGRAEGGRFLNGGLYGDQLAQFLDLFPAENLLVVLFETIKTRPEHQLDLVSRFLGLSGGLSVPPVGEKVKDKTQAVISPGLRRLLKPLKPIVKPFRDNALFGKARSVVARELDYPALSSDLRLRLVDYYAPQIERLGGLIGQDLSPWLNDIQTSTEA